MGYYIQMFSPHGLIRYDKAEIGRDKDTGGQVKYVLELLEALSKEPEVRKVDLFTRKIADNRVSPSYGNDVEVVNEKARIVRVQCGGLQYKEKEQLWNHLDEFVDKTIRFIKTEKDLPDVVHGHYADGNYIAGEVSKVFGTLFISTGHSLGRNKQDILLGEGLSAEKIESKFNMNRRIFAEEEALEYADAVIVSTNYEIESQYHQYRNRDKARFEVISPGTNTSVFYPFYRSGMPGYTMSTEEELAMFRVNSEIERFLFAPEKPLILSLGRADKRKKFEAIITSYGQDKELQAMANLAIFAGVRKDISLMSAEEQETLTNLLLLMDKYDLYGKLAIPKKNDPAFEVPEIYRIAARKRGVFVNATPGENFGLTLIEAAACGLPVVASPTGGPKEIVSNGNNGLLVDVGNPKEISDALKKIISDGSTWDKFSENSIRTGNEDYSWNNHTRKYLNLLNELSRNKKKITETKAYSFGSRVAQSQIFCISDLDGTLLEKTDQRGLTELKAFLVNHNQQITFGISTGRNKWLTEEALSNYDSLPETDFVICSVGTEIYYTREMIPDQGWATHISYQWKREQLMAALSDYPGIRLQEKEAQTTFKLSYYTSMEFSDDDMADLHRFLDERQLRAEIFLTDNKYLDLIPIRAGKGKALRYLSYKWKKPVQNFIVAGNGGNDIGMFGGRTNGIVVSNYSKELEVLKGKTNVYFAPRPLAEGVLDGINYYIQKKPHLKRILNNEILRME